MEGNGRDYLNSIETHIGNLISRFNKKPKLVVITTKYHSTSQIYIKQKEKACKRVGIAFELLELYKEPQDKIISAIRELNKDDSVSGIILDTPLREGLFDCLIEEISPLKDVEGVTAVNMGRLIRGENVLLEPCTPGGVISLLKQYKIPLDGNLCVIIGRSNIVGKPLSMMMLRENATPIICHTHTKNLKELTRQADILVCAVGEESFIKPDWIKEGVVLVDVGINRGKDEKIHGDIDPECYSKSSFYTPVPNGIGQSTVASLLVNCYLAFVCKEGV